MGEDMYYEHPVQLRYWDTEQKSYVGGIGYQDYIVSGIDGMVIPIRDIVQKARTKDNRDADCAIVELSWIDIELAIRGA